MGNYSSQPTNVVQDTTSVTNYADAVKKLGQPTQVSTRSDSFCAYSDEKNNFLAGDWKNRFDNRYEWSRDKEYVICFILSYSLPINSHKSLSYCIIK